VLDILIYTGREAAGKGFSTIVWGDSACALALNRHEGEEKGANEQTLGMVREEFF